MDYQEEIKQVFENARGFTGTLTERHDDTTTLAVQISALMKANEDAFLLISRQIDELASSRTG